MSETNPRASEEAVVIAYDFSKHAGVALARGLAVAHAQGSVPHVVHVAQARGPQLLLASEAVEDELVSVEELSRRLAGVVQTYVDDLTGKLAEPGFRGVFSHLRVGEPVDQVCALASELSASLLVTGTHGRRGIRRLVMGSVAENLVRKAPCTVLVVRAREEGEQVRIEPACPRCVEVRRNTGGQKLWCSDHSDPIGRRHTYHEVTRNVRARENHPLLIPMGN